MRIYGHHRGVIYLDNRLNRATSSCTVARASWLYVFGARGDFPERDHRNVLLVQAVTGREMHARMTSSPRGPALNIHATGVSRLDLIVISGRLAVATQVTHLAGQSVAHLRDGKIGDPYHKCHYTLHCSPAPAALQKQHMSRVPRGLRATIGAG